MSVIHSNFLIKGKQKSSVVWHAYSFHFFPFHFFIRSSVSVFCVCKSIPIIMQNFNKNHSKWNTAKLLFSKKGTLLLLICICSDEIELISKTAHFSSHFNTNSEKKGKKWTWRKKLCVKLFFTRAAAGE